MGKLEELRDFKNIIKNITIEEILKEEIREEIMSIANTIRDLNNIIKLRGKPLDL